MKMEEMERKCGLYVRVSTPRQAAVEEGSLDTQVSQLKAYLKFENQTKNGTWRIGDIYREEGRSAKDLKRPEFERMMQDIESGEINTIVIWKIDRLTRSLADFYHIWDILEKKGVQLVSLNEKFDTHTAFGRAALKLLLIFAELEREQTSERTSATLAYRASQGLWNGGRVIGYEPDSESKGGLRVIDEDAAIVRLAYDRCMELGSASATMRFLNEKGYRVPTYISRRGKEQGGGMFNKQATVRLLTNPVYVGDIQWKDQVFQGQHEPIIDRAKFDKVQELIDANRKRRAHSRKQKRHVFLLQGLVRCGCCGSIMTPAWATNGSGQPYHYYQCTRRQHSGKQACKARTVPAKALEDLVLERLKELSTDDTEIASIVDKANGRKSEMLKKLRRDKKQIQREIQNVTEKLNGLVKAVEEGGAQAFKSISKRMADLELEKAGLEEQIQQIGFEQRRVEEETLSAETMVETFRSFREILEEASPERLKSLVQRVVEVIEWNEDDENPGSGHYRMAFFEQPKLGIPLSSEGNGVSGSNCSVSGMKWLQR